MIGDTFDAVLHEARSGSHGAFASIYGDLAPVVRGLARGKGLTDPDDVLSETMLSVARGLKRFQGNETEFRSWVLTIAYRRIADEFRGRYRRVPTVSLDGQAESSGTESAETAALARDLSPQVVAALAALTEDQRDVVLLRIIADLPIAEVARIVGKKEGAVKVIQLRALRAMAVTLQPAEAAHVTPVPVSSDRRG